MVRLVLATKAVSLARGHSGVRPEIAEALLALSNADVLPCIPAKGSVGASGDLAPLAHMACVLIGEGEATASDGEVVSGKRSHGAASGLAPFVLGPKEGLALLNGTQVSTALALAGLFGAEDVFAAALMAGCLSLEAIKGSIKPFDARIHAARGQPGQIAVAGAVRALLEGSAIDPLAPRLRPRARPVFDPLRAAGDGRVPGQPAARRARARASRPMPRRTTRWCSDNGDVISGGNFHAEPVAFAADIIALAVAEIGAISERRTVLAARHRASRACRLSWCSDGGVNSGFMIAQVTAAALASENKSPGQPQQRDQPADLGQPGRPCVHGDLRAHAAWATWCDNTAVMVGIEAMAAAQGIELEPQPEELAPASKPSSPPSASVWPIWSRTASSRPTSKPCAHGRSSRSWPDATAGIACPATPEYVTFQGAPHERQRRHPRRSLHRSPL